MTLNKSISEHIKKFTLRTLLISRGSLHLAGGLQKLPLATFRFSCGFRRVAKPFAGGKGGLVKTRLDGKSTIEI